MVHFLTANNTRMVLVASSKNFVHPTLFANWCKLLFIRHFVTYMYILQKIAYILHTFLKIAQLTKIAKMPELSKFPRLLKNMKKFVHLHPFHAVTDLKRISVLLKKNLVHLYYLYHYTGAEFNHTSSCLLHKHPW